MAADSPNQSRSAKPWDLSYEWTSSAACGSAAAASRPLTPAALSAPQSVIRGANSQGVSLDWIRCVCSRSRLNEIGFFLEKFFGPCAKESRGRFFRERGKTWGTAGMWWNTEDDATDSIVVEVPGSMLAVMGPEWGVDLLRDFVALGMKFTRIDIAFDVRGEGIDLVQRFAESVRAGEMVRLRKASYTPETQGSEITNEIVRLGTRGGSGGGKYIRVYDKGLETGTAKYREWVRVEAELADDVANQAAREIADSDDPASSAMSILSGCVAFHENNGSEEVSRRPMCQWWRDFLGAHKSVRLVSKRIASSAATHVQWLTRCVVGQARVIAERFGMTLDDYFDALCGVVKPATDFLREQTAIELCSFLSGNDPRLAVV